MKVSEVTADDVNVKNRGYGAIILAALFGGPLCYSQNVNKVGHFAFTTHSFNESISDRLRGMPSTDSDVGSFTSDVGQSSISVLPTTIDISRNMLDGSRQKLIQITATSSMSQSIEVVPPAQTWISVPVRQATTPAVIPIWIDLTVPPGVYETVLTIRFNLSKDTVDVPVRLNTVAEWSWSFIPDVMRLRAVTQNTGDSRLVQVTSSTGSEFRIKRSPSWITASIVQSGNQRSISAFSNARGLPPGEYSGEIEIESVPSGVGGLLSVELTVVSCSGGAPSSISFTQNSHQLSFPIYTRDNCEWTVQSDDEWIVVNTPTGFGPSTVYISAKQNLGKEARRGAIRILQNVITVTQQADLPEIEVTRDNLTRPAIVNGASYAFGPRSPGEIVSIFGNYFQTADNSLSEYSSDSEISAGRPRLPLSAAGTAVYFDDVRAPLLMASPTQINAIVPFSLVGKSNVMVRVERQGIASKPVRLDLRTSTLGVFTIENQGFGQARAWKSSGQSVTKLERAVRGSTVELIATGAGQTFPYREDGFFAEDAPAPLLSSLRVFVGDIEAPVVFAGSLPGVVNGAISVKFVIPPDAPRGERVPIILVIEKDVSQSNVFLPIE